METGPHPRMLLALLTVLPLHMDADDATSDDGLAWRRHESNPVIHVIPSNRWESGTIAVPRVILDDRLYRVWYCCYPQKNTYAVGCAESHDCIHWTRSPHNPVLSGSGKGWDSGMTAYPSVVRVSERYLMWYSGNGYGSQGIGLATADVPRGAWWYRTEVNGRAGRKVAILEALDGRTGRRAKVTCSSPSWRNDE